MKVVEAAAVVSFFLCGTHQLKKKRAGATQRQPPTHANTEHQLRKNSITEYTCCPGDDQAAATAAAAHQPMLLNSCWMHRPHIDTPLIK
jgi:hypothetical protein